MHAIVHYGRGFMGIPTWKMLIKEIKMRRVKKERMGTTVAAECNANGKWDVEEAYT